MFFCNSTWRLGIAALGVVLASNFASGDDRAGHRDHPRALEALVARDAYGLRAKPFHAWNGNESVLVRNRPDLMISLDSSWDQSLVDQVRHWEEYKAAMDKFAAHGIPAVGVVDIGTYKD